MESASVSFGRLVAMESAFVLFGRLALESAFVSFGRLTGLGVSVCLAWKTGWPWSQYFSCIGKLVGLLVA